jgi:hypothetical protein
MFGVHSVGGMAGILLASLCAAALIGGTTGLLGGNPQFLLTRLSGIAATFGWSRLDHFRAVQTGWRLWTHPCFVAAEARRPRYFAARLGSAIDYPT